MLIKGPLESLISGKINDNTLGYYKMLLRNTEKLQLLIDQLLELSQLEADSIPLKVDLYDIVDVVKSCYNNFMSIAQQKKINYSFYSTQESVNSIIDKDKLEKIINNLLSNALKFTSKNGSIFVEITKLETKGLGAILISVKDNGIGIPQESLEKIFDRFYQADNSSKRNYGGSGIGLALVKELATVNKWDIDVKSEENAGTEFTLNIPLTSNFTSEYKKQQVNDLVSAVQPDNEVVSNRSLADQLSSGNSLILLVEDSEDVRTYVNDLLKKDYKILLADSGEEGIELTKNNLPDLIISDVMMTGMDGFEFCKRIKSDWKTSDIPIILLTAKVDHQSKLDGLELGADDYITKPFNHQELLIRIKNLIAKRKGLKNKYGKKILRPTAGSKSYNKEEHQLIDKAVKVIEKYLFDENFNTEILAKELFMSRSQLSRKLHSINGQGPGEFIRTYKLNRSAKMILEKKLSITQIAYEVGFGSPAQFTRAFQKYFNCLPSEFSLTNHTQKV